MIVSERKRLGLIQGDALSTVLFSLLGEAGWHNGRMREDERSYIRTMPYTPLMPCLTAAIASAYPLDRIVSGHR
eukprot:6487224-Amphidinium_carterae.1